MTKLFEQLETALTTIKEMLRDRKITDIIESVTVNDIIANINRNETFTIQITESGIHLLFLMAAKFKTSTTLKNILTIDEIEHFIVISREKLKTMNLRIFNEVTKKKEYWSLDELQFNISNHIYVPKHEIVPDNEVQEIMKKFLVKTKTNFPLILKTDPMARYLHIKSGQLVKITRNTPNAVNYVLYRYCI